MVQVSKETHNRIRCKNAECGQTIGYREIASGGLVTLDTTRVDIGTNVGDEGFRYYCKSCGASYPIVFNNSLVEGRMDAAITIEDAYLYGRVTEVNPVMMHPARTKEQLPAKDVAQQCIDAYNAVKDYAPIIQEALYRAGYSYDFHLETFTVHQLMQFAQCLTGERSGKIEMRGISTDLVKVLKESVSPSPAMPGQSGMITSHWIVTCATCHNGEFCNGMEGARSLGYKKVKGIGWVCSRHTQGPKP